MTPFELRDMIRPLDAGGPIYRQLEADLVVGGRPSRPWYDTQKQHLLGWLGEYDGPGAYGRANWENRSAEFVYNHFQCAPALVWLAEALGVPSEILLAACDDVRQSGKNSAKQCGVFRRAVPWSMIEECLLRRPKMQMLKHAATASKMAEWKPTPIGGFGHKRAPRK